MTLAGGCIVGAASGAVFGPLGVIYGAILGTVLASVASLVVVPVVTMWLRAPGTQGRSVAWVRRRTQILAMVLTALVACCLSAALEEGPPSSLSILVYLVPSLIAVAYAGWAAHYLVGQGVRYRANHPVLDTSAG